MSDFFKIRKDLKYNADTMLEVSDLKFPKFCWHFGKTILISLQLKLFVNTLRIANVKICNGFFTLDQSTFISVSIELFPN